MPIDLHNLILEIQASELFEDRHEITWFFKHFDETPPCKVLEVGAANEDILFVLSRLGYDCVGVDLKVYIRPFHLGYEYYAKDFNILSGLFQNTFNVVISISTLEHFGLPVNVENHLNNQMKILEQYDVLTVQNIWRSLKPDGVVYLTVPFGKEFTLFCQRPLMNEPNMVYPMWRVYNSQSLKHRIIQNFELLREDFIVVAPFKQFCPGREINEAEASTFTNVRKPAVMVGLKMRKPK